MLRQGNRIKMEFIITLLFLSFTGKFRVPVARGLPVHETFR